MFSIMFWLEEINCSMDFNTKSNSSQIYCVKKCCKFNDFTFYHRDTDSVNGKNKRKKKLIVQSLKPYCSLDLFYHQHRGAS